MICANDVIDASLLSAGFFPSFILGRLLQQEAPEGGILLNQFRITKCKQQNKVPRDFKLELRI